MTFVRIDGVLHQLVQILSVAVGDIEDFAELVRQMLLRKFLAVIAVGKRTGRAGGLLHGALLVAVIKGILDRGAAAPVSGLARVGVGICLDLYRLGLKGLLRHRFAHGALFGLGGGDHLLVALHLGPVIAHGQILEGALPARVAKAVGHLAVDLLPGEIQQGVVVQLDAFRNVEIHSRAVIRVSGLRHVAHFAAEVIRRFLCAGNGFRDRAAVIGLVLIVFYGVIIEHHALDGIRIALALLGFARGGNQRHVLMPLDIPFIGYREELLFVDIDSTDLRVDEINVRHGTHHKVLIAEMQGCEFSGLALAAADDERGGRIHGLVFRFRAENLVSDARVAHAHVFRYRKRYAVIGAGLPFIGGHQIIGIIVAVFAVGVAGGGDQANHTRKDIAARHLLVGAELQILLRYGIDGVQIVGIQPQRGDHIVRFAVHRARSVGIHRKTAQILEIVIQRHIIIPDAGIIDGLFKRRSTRDHLIRRLRVDQRRYVGKFVAAGKVDIALAVQHAVRHRVRPVVVFGVAHQLKGVFHILAFMRVNRKMRDVLNGFLGTENGIGNAVAVVRVDISDHQFARARGLVELDAAVGDQLIAVLRTIFAVTAQRHVHVAARTRKLFRFIGFVALDGAVVSAANAVYRRTIEGSAANRKVRSVYVVRKDICAAEPLEFAAVDVSLPGGGFDHLVTVFGVLPVAPERTAENDQLRRRDHFEHRTPVDLVKFTLIRRKRTIGFRISVYSLIHLNYGA